MKFFGLLLVLLLLLPGGTFAQAINRDAAYQDALPLYQDDATKPAGGENH